MRFVRRRAGAPSEQRGETFTGTVYADPVLSDPHLAVNGVLFTPGARTHWHRHEGGQLLTVDKGRGIVADRHGDARFVEAADVVYTAPDEEHWHGAAPDALMLHTSVAIGSTIWLEAVDQATYDDAVRRAGDRDD